MPCGACLRGWSAPRSLRSLGGRLARLRRAPPASRGLPPGGQAGGLWPPLPASRRCPPSVGLTSVRLSPPPRHGHFATLRDRAPSGFDSLRSRHAAVARSSLSATPLGRGLQSGGRAPQALADRAPPPLGVGRWGALKPTTLRCRFSPGGSPVRRRPCGCAFGGCVETLASLTSTCPVHVLAVTPFGRSAMTARLPPGQRFASPQSALESFGLKRQAALL